ncbi:MAG: NAD(+) diphosphatase [Anaerostipes sp.]|nr:NAD(+) diphosphatase [Anaerostipes sp.]
MIQDIFPLKFDNQFYDRKPQKESFVFGFKERNIYLKQEGENAELLTYGKLEDVCTREDKPMPEMVYLFSIDDKLYFLADLDRIKIPGYQYVPLFTTRSMNPKETVMAISTAWHLQVWYRDNQYCGKCGKKLSHHKNQRMMYCKDCNNMIFPKIAPAVIVGITKGDKILLTKYADREYKRYALIAGFTEIGETPEETVSREAMEEVGVTVKNISYYKSQPWGYDSNLLMGYFCELDGSSHIDMDEEELATAEWVNYQDVPENLEGLSLTAEMMTVFKMSRERKHSGDRRQGVGC